jgi:benzoyl-CoA reductase/2-hydroxyglutaryl-CoA dehydratase subunit BcrC/BadD/HgdB
VHKEFGAFVVNTMIGTNTTLPAQDISNRRKMMEALARELRNIPMNRECWGSVEDWLEYAIPTCQDWKIDVVILTAHIGCKNMWAMHKLFKDKLASELGIPTLIVEADIADARPFSSEDQKAQISDFFNTVMV